MTDHRYLLEVSSTLLSVHHLDKSLLLTEIKQKRDYVRVQQELCNTIIMI